MDFQELLNIAAQNKKRAEEEATVHKRYSTQISAPKKVKRVGVDQAAIRARLDKKQQDIKQKASEEEAKKQQLLKLREESKNNKRRKSTEKKTQVNGRPSNDRPNNNYEDKKHEVRHRSFMDKVQKVVRNGHQEDETKTVSKPAPDRPKKPKKPAVVAKGPMSYKDILALAAEKLKRSSQTGDGDGDDAVRGKCATAKQTEDKTRAKDRDMDRKKALAARKLGEIRRKQFLEQRRGNSDETRTKDKEVSSGKMPSSSANGTSRGSHRTNGKVIASSDKRGTESGARRQDSSTSKPATSNSKTKHSSGPRQNSAQKCLNGAQSNNHRQRETGVQRQPTPKTSHQSRVDEYSDKAPSGSRPRPVPEQRPPPKHQSKLDKYYERAPSSSRPQPGSNRAPSSSRPQPGSDRRGGQMPRKRSASTPVFRSKNGRLLSDDESDYEANDGFIDDTPLEENNEQEDVSQYIKEIFGYDKSKYGYESDHALRFMDSSYRDIQKEEARSARLGMAEDLEDIRREKEEEKRKRQKLALKKKR